MFSRIAALISAVILLICAGVTPALAHASLQSCSIKNGQTLPSSHIPASIHATFAEPLDVQANRSFMQVFEGTGDHGLVTESQHSMVNYRNPRQMSLALPRHLNKGKYYLLWYTHSAADGHYAAGVLYFSVK